MSSKLILTCRSGVREFSVQLELIVRASSKRVGLCDPATNHGSILTGPVYPLLYKVTPFNESKISTSPCTTVQ